MSHSASYSEKRIELLKVTEKGAFILKTENFISEPSKQCRQDRTAGKIIMRKRTNFISLIKLWGIIFLIGIGASIVAIDVIASYRDFNSRADQMRADYIARQKQIIKQE